MRLLALLTLLASSSPRASTVFGRPVIQLVSAQTAPTSPPHDEEDEEEAPKAPPTQVSPPPPPETPQAPTAPAAPKPLAAPALTLTNPETQRLVSGAPLFNPNVAVHIVEQKQFSDRGRHEIIAYPAALQFNGKFTQHYGSDLSYVYHLHENFAFQASVQYNWYSSETGFNEELIDKVRREASAATSLLLVGGAVAGVEVTPFYGKFAWYQGTLVHFALVLNAGAGAGLTRIGLKPANAAGPATFGDTGPKFLGSIGGGFRVLLGDRFALRLEVRDLVYTARVDTINGCNSDDLTKMQAAIPTSASQVNPSYPSPPAISSTCNTDSFKGQAGAYNRSGDVPIAQSLVQNPTSDVLNNVGFYAGVAVLF